MKFTLLALGASLAFLSADALTLVKKDSPSVVSLPFERTLGIPASQNRKRSTVETVLNNEQLVYTVALMLGTPPQSTRVQLDTGSSDLVVETDSSNLYDANSSSTYQYLNGDFLVAYGGGDGASGDNALDILSIGGAVIQNMQFGIMYTTTVLEGILGVGFTGIEGQVLNFGDPPYNNLPVLLVQQGYIESRAFSVYLNDDTGTGGTVLFGGVDTEKYLGSLVTLPLVPAAGTTDINQFFVTLLNVQMTDPSGNAIILSGTVGSTPVPALLDTGTTETILPQSIASAIFNVLNADLSSPPGVYVDCSLASTSYTVDFMFAGITIHVPLSQLIIPNGAGVSATECQLGISSASDSTVILGDTFLSSASRSQFFVIKHFFLKTGFTNFLKSYILEHFINKNFQHSFIY
ncbi:hypothetical protein G7Y89_g5612 [Cudoniella acicularis]|uniref:Peptidase A1 domain-containing protein n=1 Tax=Cudoniella acicularis TaxID=354080 RepID=A0A8H4RPF5_9HELO|nr:hypothetical protein G7Y89_g5612 [Cudoniella acicularis]